MFHSHDNLFFARRTNGDVRILKFNKNPGPWLPTLSADMVISNEFYSAGDFGTPPLIRLDMTIPSDMWASVVASVSARGEMDGRFFIAKKFHNETINPTDQGAAT